MMHLKISQDLSPMRLAPPEDTYLIFLMFIFLGLGFLGTHYYVKHETRFSGPVYSTDEILRTRALSHQLNRLEYKNAHLESEIAELNWQTTHLYQDTSLTKAYELTPYTGLFPQEGPGVQVILKDSTKPLLLGDNANTGIVHNTDLVEMVNELRAHGAKAIAINNQPIMGLTAITCSGPVIMVNGARIASPFTIDAVGDTPKMKAQLEQSSSFLQELKTYGIEASFVTKSLVVVPASSAESVEL